jgi:hypothetical protein
MCIAFDIKAAPDSLLAEYVIKHLNGDDFDDLDEDGNIFQVD